MKNQRLAALALILLCATTAGAVEREAPAFLEFQTLERAVDRGEAPLRRIATIDTFVLYGGPGTTEGKFENASGQPDFGGWTPVDRTESHERWQRTTFLAETVGTTGPGNHAMWAGRDGTADGWPGGVGYGNRWNLILQYESSPVADPSVPQTVLLDFAYQQDAEPGYDEIQVQVERWSTWETLAFLPNTATDGQGAFVGPGGTYAEHQFAPIEFGNQYDYPEDRRIRIRIVFRSDGLYSDEDGNYDSIGGAWIDDVSLTTHDGSLSEDFEGDGPYLFEPYLAWAGDFADVYPGVDDLDPCRENDSGVVAFVDRGQTVRNPMPDGTSSTGGVFNPNEAYGPDGASVNGMGGLSGEHRIWNEIVSPAIDLTLPEPYESDPEMLGFRLEFELWRHKGTGEPVTFSLYMRSADAHGNWTSWRGGIGYDSAPDWLDARIDLHQYLPELITDGHRQLQVALGAFGTSIGDNVYWQTPAPYFDNVRVKRTRLPGPSFHGSNRFQSAFPASGGLANATPAERDALDIRLDEAHGDPDHPRAVPDSLLFRVETTVSGTTIVDTRMVWTLRRNPWFEDAIRELPSRPVDENVTVNGDLWSGEVVAQESHPGQPYSSLFVDLPDADFFYPGDVLHYSFRAVDSDGRVQTLPADRSGFGEFHGLERALSDYDPEFTVRGLPSLGGTGLDGNADPTVPPRTLVFNDMGPDDEHELIAALGAAGFQPGYDVDLYTMVSPGNDDDRRLHGAIGTPSLEQLGAYDTIVWPADWSIYFSDDFQEAQAIQAWRDLPGDRTIVWFVDGSPTLRVQIESVFAAATLASPYWLSEDTGLYDEVDVEPATGSGMQTPFAVQLFCPQERRTRRLDDDTFPVGHTYANAGIPIPDLAASVSSERTDTLGDRDVDLLFPFAIDRIRAIDGGTNSSTAGRVLREALQFVGSYAGSFPTSAPADRRGVALDVAPSPFNPKTVVQLTTSAAGPARVTIFDVRGQRVRTLVDGHVEAGTHPLRWNGDDDRGERVATGVYFVRAESGGEVRTRKVALIK